MSDGIHFQRSSLHGDVAVMVGDLDRGGLAELGRLPAHRAPAKAGELLRAGLGDRADVASALTFAQTGTGAVVVHVREPADDGYALGLLTQPEAARTAGALLRAAIGDEAFAAVTGALRVGLDGADEESTGHTDEVLGAAWQSLAWLEGQTSSKEETGG